MYEEKILGAEEKILELEQSIFQELLNELQEYISPLQANGQAIATLDCLCSFSILAIANQYRKPLIHDGEELILKESRHPVIEKKIGRAHV